MGKFVYVTYRIELCDIITNFKKSVCKWAIKCNTMETALEVASERSSLINAKFVHINKCGKLPKGTKIIDYQTYAKDMGVDNFVEKFLCKGIVGLETYSTFALSNNKGKQPPYELVAKN